MATLLLFGMASSCEASSSTRPATGPGGTTGTGGTAGTGATTGTGGGLSTGGQMGSGGVEATGGSAGPGGHEAGTGGTIIGTGGLPGSGGQPTGAGGAPGAGGANGSGGAGTAGTAGAGGADAFVLAWQDDFNSLDTNRWRLQSFTYATNLAEFTPQNASVANGILTIKLTANPNSTTEPYWGVEMRSATTLKYGKVSARMRFAAGSGVVSGLVLFYTPYPNCNWNEIDIEHLGGSSNTSQLNCQVYLGTPNPNCTTSVSATQDPQIVNLGVNAETDFHQYDIEWTPSGVATYVDGRLLRTWTVHATLMNLPQNVLFTIWASSVSGWAGPLTSTSAPTSADVDWIKVYNWKG